MNRELNAYEVNKVKTCARAKLGEYRKINDIMGYQIFSILQICARVIYYPLGKDAPWGFTRLTGSQNNVQHEKPFVAINTSIPSDCQVFAAAHELYHIWYGKNSGNDEKLASRFAAEFLVDEVLLRQELDLRSTGEITIKSILQLCEIFAVPYRTMVRRLNETGMISEQKMAELLAISEKDIECFRRRYSFVMPKADERVVMDNLPELAATAYEKGLITFEKLEYLLGLSKLTPEDIANDKAPEYEFPTDDEIDSIMEE